MAETLGKEGRTAFVEVKNPMLLGVHVGTGMKDTRSGHGRTDHILNDGGNLMPSKDVQTSLM